MMILTKRTISHLNGYSYNGGNEKDGVKRESETKDRNRPFIIAMVIKEMNAVYYDTKNMRCCINFQVLDV